MPSTWLESHWRRLATTTGISYLPIVFFFLLFYTSFHDWGLVPNDTHTHTFSSPTSEPRMITFLSFTTFIPILAFISRVAAVLFVLSQSYQTSGD